MHRPNPIFGFESIQAAKRLILEASLSGGVVVWLDQFDMADVKRLCQLKQGNHCWITPAAFETAEVLLAEAGTLFDLLLSQPFLPTQTGEIPANQLAHIHTQTDGSLHILSLSTIVCFNPKYLGRGARRKLLVHWNRDFAQH